MKMFIFVSCCILGSILNAASAQDSPIVHVSASAYTGALYNGLPSTYADVDFQLNVNVMLNMSQYGHTVSVSIQLPHSIVESTGQRCKQLMSGATYDCVQTSSSKVIYASADTTSVNVTLGANLRAQSPRIVSMQDDTVIINLGVIVDDNVDYVGDDLISVTIKTRLLDGYDSVYKRDYIVKAVVDGQTSLATRASVRMIGTFLNAAISAYGYQGEGVEAGESVAYQMHITHSSGSTETATDIKFVVSFDSTQAPLVDGTAFYQSSLHSTPVSFNGAHMLAGTMTVLNTMATTQYFTIVFQRLALDAIELGPPLTLSLQLQYKDSQGHAYIRTKHFAVATQPINFGSFPRDQKMDTHFPIGKIIVIQKTFLMPKGTMKDFTLFTAFSSYDYSPIPLLMSTRGLAYLEKPDYVHCNKTLLYGKDFTISSSSKRRRRDLANLEGHRHRRATQSSLDADVIFGDIVNPAVGGISNASVTFTLRFPVDDVDLGGVMAAKAGLTYSGVTQQMTDLTGYVDKPQLTINKTVEMHNSTARPNIIRFNITVEHTALSNAAAYNVELNDGSRVFDVFWGDQTIGPRYGDEGFTVVDNKLLTWTRHSLDNTKTMVLSYKAEPSQDGALLPEGNSYYNATLSYTTAEGSSQGFSYSLVASCCIKRVTVVVPDIFYNYGLTVLTLVCSIILGILLVILLLFIMYIVCKRTLFGSSVHPTSGDSSSVRFQTSRVEHVVEKQLVTDVRMAKRKSFSTIKNLSTYDTTDSIVAILAMPDRIKSYQELDSLDILSTVNVDESIEKERNSAMVSASKALVQSLRENGDISKATEAKCLDTFNKNVNNLEKTLDDDFQREMEALFSSLSNKNKEKLTDLLEKHEVEKEDTKERIATMSQQQQTEVLELLNKEQQLARDDLTHILKLEQDEETEKLRKEFAIRRRIGLKGLQQNLMDDVKNSGQLTSEQADWLMKEHLRTQANLENLYDDEISRQRMLLEEKLSRRRMLAEVKNTQEDNENELLEAMATDQLNLIQKAKKDGTLARDEAKVLVENLEKEMELLKTRQEDEKRRMQKSLHERLSERKKKAIDEQKKKQEKELAEFDKKNKSSQTAGVDPLSVLESRQQLISHQRAELSSLENDLDGENAAELEKINEESFEKTKDELQKTKADLVTKLIGRGVDEDELKKLYAKHDKHMTKLVHAQEESKQKQNENFKMRLAAGEKEWRRKRDEEREEQQTLRQHEDKVVRTLLGNQVAMSETERDKILQEHEKQMVKLENSLTLNKLQQKRMLEEKLAHKRAVAMEKLQSKQLAEEKKKKKKKLADESDDEDEDQPSEVAMYKKHAEQRLAVMQTDDYQLETELEDIRAQLTKERGESLKEQEVRLGAMVAQLQLDKAKQMSKIEEQQKAIHNLKSSLMDDLNEKGVLSDPECQRVIQIHEQEEAKLNKKLDSQRKKQEKTLKKKLQERLKQKEEMLSRLHEQQLEEAMQGCATSMALKIRRAVMMEKHMLEMEQFRNRMELEINQTLEEVKRQNELKRLESCQDQELQFINGLVRLGKFHMTELDHVLTMLFPRKTEQERKLLLDTLCEGYKAPPAEPPSPQDEKQQQQQQPPGLTRRLSSLEIRVKSAAYGQHSVTPRPLPISEGDKAGRRKKRNSMLKNRRRSKVTAYEFSSEDRRPEPVGRSFSPTGLDYGETEMLHNRNSRRRLAPLYR